MSGSEFARLADLFPEALILVDRSGAIHAANTAAVRQCEYSLHELTALTLAQLSNDEPSAISSYLKHCAQGRTLLPGALTLIRNNGEPLPCRCEGALYQPATDGKPALILLRITSKEAAIHRFIALNRQIGELSTEILRRKRLETALEQERELLQVTLSGIGDAVIATDVAGCVTFINPVAEALTGWSRAEALGRPLLEVFNIVNEDTRQLVESPIAKVLRDDAITKLFSHTLLIAKDGTELPIDHSGAPIRAADRSIIGAVLVFHDITERRGLERALQARANDLEKIGRRKDEFLAMLSHELRNPIAPVRNGIYALERLYPDHPQATKVLAIMKRQVNQLVRLVDDLLDVSRITGGKIRLRMQAIDLVGVLKHVAEAAAPIMKARSHELSVSLPQRLLMQGDETRLNQIFANLLDNAAKYTETRGNIVLICYEDRADAVVKVRDNGIGIAPELLPDIFEFFTQADKSLDRAQGGLGIGLGLVKTLVELHAGRVAVVSEGLGKGSEFIVRIPRVNSAESLRVPAPPLPQPAESGHLRKRVMIVDDNADVADSLAFIVSSWNYEVRTVYSSNLVIDLLRNFAPDAVLLDIGLPGNNGYDVAREIRKEFGGRMLVIALTGYGDEAYRQRGKEAGFDEHLTKPAELEILRRLLSEGRA